jgi:putative peptidoglycan lipid II flippase
MTDVARSSLITLGVSVVTAGAVWGIAEVTGLHRMSTEAGKIGSVAYLAITAIVVLGVVYLMLTALKLPDMVAISNTVMRLVGRFIPKLAPAPEPEADRDSHTMTVQFPRISSDESFPYAGQVDVRRRFDRGTATWQEYSAYSGGAAGETTVIPVIRPGRPARPPMRPAHGPSQPQRPGGVQPMSGPDSDDERRPSTEPTRAMIPKADAPAQPRGPKLVPGAAVAGGRYRLLEPQGGTRGLAFWRAKDTGLDREVGLTFVDPQQLAPPINPGDRDPQDEGPQAILHRTRRLGQLHTAGVARVLDVVRSASGGIVVTEWVNGSTLAEVAATAPSATGAARAVRALAAGAEAAHRAGAVLSIDHPDRIRISSDGDAVLAFPAILADDDRSSDVRGLGAVLYALLLNRWTLDGETGKELATAAIARGLVGGMRLADPDPRNPGQPIAPMQARQEIPFEISAVASRALEGDRGIRTAATVQHVLDQATVVDLQTDMLPRVETRQPPVSVAPISRTRKERLMGEGQAGKRNVALLAGGALFILFVIVAVIVAATNMFASPDDENNLDSFLPGSSSSAAQTPGTDGGSPVSVAAVTLLDVSDQDPDSSSNISNVLNGASPAWKTDNYRGAQFAGLKDGLGLMFRLKAPASVKSVTVETTTPGFSVELRTAARKPASLDATTEVGNGTVDAKKVTLKVGSPSTSGYFILWLTSLPENGSGYQAVINRVTLR